MTRAVIAGGALLATVLVLLALSVGQRGRGQDLDLATAASIPSSADETYRGFLYGRVTTDDGATYEGRLRWGGTEEAFWGDYFNGFKDENPWVAHAPPEQLKERRPLEILGFELAHWDRPIDVGRPFMARFGDIARIEPKGRDLWVTLKSGTVFLLDRFAADDVADGLRVWDGRHGVVDIDEWRIRTIDFLPTAPFGVAPDRLYGTVQTRQGDYTGFIQWDREEGVGSDELDGLTDDGALGLRFDAIRSIERNSPVSARVTLLDGGQMVLSGTRNVGDGNRGLYVDDSRYGRVLISWDAFERVDFHPGGTGPAYGDFAPGRPLLGRVTTRDGRILAGRLVYDLDESETTETLDAPFRGVDYTIPFGLIASIGLSGPEGRGPEGTRVILLSGEALQLERAGDLGEQNAGLLVFIDGSEQPEYVRWADVVQIDFARPPR